MDASLLPLLAAAAAVVLALLALLRRPRTSAQVLSKGKNGRQTVVADATGEKDDRPTVKLLYGTQT